MSSVPHPPGVHRPAGKADALEEVRQLQAVTDAALAHLELDHLLEELLLRIRDALRADTSAFLLLDETGNELVARAAKGIEEEVERGVRIPVDKGFAGRIAADRRPVVIADVDHADIYNPILREKGIKSLLGAPLITGERLLGVVHVGTLTPRQFDADDVHLLEIVAQRAAVAIDRARAHEEVVRLTHLQRDFVALAAHELRTPASIVYGLAATLAGRTDLSEETVAEIHQTLHAQADRMRRLVEQLLDLSRLDAATIEVNPQRLLLPRDLTDIVRAAAVGHEDEISVETPDTTEVVADRAVLERVVTNLLANAIHYGAPPITVVARQTDTHLRIVVADSGDGIPERFVPHMFDRFRRAEDAKGKQPGTGLGLSIARSYARAHGGELFYIGGDGGARFELVLPRTSAVDS